MTVVLENVGKTFKGAQIPALQGISARFEPGKIIGLIGPDGAGKTTLLRLIAGLLAPTSGRILAFGADVERETPRVRRFLGYMPQKFGLYEDLTVLENLQFYAKLRALPRRERAGRFAELLETVGLAPFQNRLARRLSGGMKQKL
ncbi:MAG: ABC transporter ATP-binding protein, partial [Thermoguttaceae bacterium]|nr:ABC transporter ATP-binding protein [Thermoguttaceae bacterium]